MTSVTVSDSVTGPNGSLPTENVASMAVSPAPLTTTSPALSAETSREIPSSDLSAASPAPTSAHQLAEELEMLRAPFADAQLEVGGDLVESLEAIPHKMAFKIGEAAEMVGVKQYVLRYWESEFEMLRPRKSKNNQRVYSRKDVETALMIKKLLYQDRFSIEGARSALRHFKSQVKEERGMKAMAQSQETAVAKLKGLLTEIRRVREIFC